MKANSSPEVTVHGQKSSIFDSARSHHPFPTCSTKTQRNSSCPAGRMRWLLVPRNPYLRSIHAGTRTRAAWFTSVVDAAGERSKMTPWRRGRGSNNLPPSTVKRRNERYLLNARLTATVCGERGETKTQTHALDISESGIGTLAGEGWDVGIHLNLKLSLPVENGFPRNRRRGATPNGVEMRPRIL